MGLLWKQEEEKMKYKLDEILPSVLFVVGIILFFAIIMFLIA